MIVVEPTTSLRKTYKIMHPKKKKQKNKRNHHIPIYHLFVLSWCADQYEKEEDTTKLVTLIFLKFLIQYINQILHK